MFKKNPKSDLQNLINHPALPVTTYVNLLDRSIVVFSNEVVGNETLLRVPDIEELYPYNNAMEDFIDEWELIIPFKIKAGRYLKENGYIQEFYTFRNEKAVEKLSEWLDSHQITNRYIA